MPTVTVNLADTFEEWRSKTNTIGTSAGDLSSLNTTDKSSLVAAINEVIVNDSDDLENIVEDTSPQLGGNLDLNNNNIIGIGNVDTTGTITATGAITAFGGFVGAINVVSDTSPSLGGDLDLNNNNITGTGSIADTVTGITQSPSDNSTKLATTAYVDAQVNTENTIEEMNDTTITTPTNGQQLIYNSVTSKWENVTSTAATQGFAVAVAIALG
jgi:hypothetical protein